ncbi:M24 family metallopeptidase [Coprobacillus cateniformis]|jgi:Xaa-Pro dipeptidase|uniref:M24 family metallopeptidase n=1 Tax=Coprobacillus cateniformis TaxID=100884 RepID=UPI0024A9B7F6|nr:Xaa-Pro peptidase family protein [Coprobacillus cateniformis]
MNQQRVNKVLEEMQTRGIDHLIISDPSSIDYLIGYSNHPGERMFVLLLSIEGNHVIFLNNLFYLDQELEMNIIWYDDTQDGPALVAQYLKDANVVGVDKNWEARFLMRVMELANDECCFELGSICVDYVRMIKEEEEKALMRESSRFNDLAIDQVIQLCAKGNLTEKEVSQEVEGIFQKLGCSGNSFAPIVAYGANGADGHHEGDNSLLKPGDSIVIDMGGQYHGYCSDMTRTVFYKEVSDEQRKVYNLVRQANEAAEAIIKPGVRLCDIDKVARDIITEAGYGKNFNHRLGHFIGRDIHEYGDVSAVFDMPVEAGMIFSIEPGIYIQGDFGVRIEDLVLVTEDGCEVLNSYSKDLLIIG